MSRFQHSMESDQHGTGPMFLGIEQEVVGRAPDLDPFSSEEFNCFVGAARIITEQQNAWRTPWHPALPAPLTCMSSCPDTRRRFVQVASRHGYVINGGSW